MLGFEQDFGPPRVRRDMTVTTRTSRRAADPAHVAFRKIQKQYQ
jgi:hypothetical protein